MGSDEEKVLRRRTLERLQEAQRKGYEYIEPIVNNDNIYQYFNIDAVKEDDIEQTLGYLQKIMYGRRHRNADPHKIYTFENEKMASIESDNGLLLLKLVTYGGRRRKMKRRAKKTAKRNKIR